MHVDVEGRARRDMAIDVVAADTVVAPSAPVSDVAHTLLRLGRLMLLSGAATEHVQEALTTLARRLGYQPHLLIFAEGLLLTLQNQHEFHTKVGPPISGMSVNMTALSALDGIVRQGLIATSDIAQIERQLDAIEHDRNGYPGWLVALGLGLAAASLARLFGGGPTVVAVTALVGILSAELRERLEALSINPIAGAATLAFVTGTAGGLALNAFPDTSPVACLVAAGTVLIPAVPLINGMRDTLGRHVGAGISHLALGIIIVLSIAFGLLLAASVTGAMLSVGSTLPRPSLGDEILFSALAGMGFAVVFNVPLRAAWGCMVCAAVGHGLRTVLLQTDVSLVIGSLAGAFAVALLARVFARRFRIPAVAFTFPGVVTLLPTPEAFRAALGALDIVHAGAAASLSLIAATIALAVTAILVIASIAIGLSLAFAAPFAVVVPYTVKVRASRDHASPADIDAV